MPSAKRRVGKRVKSGSGSNFALKAILWLLVIVSISAAVIGTGRLDSFLGQANTKYAPIRFLVERVL